MADGIEIRELPDPEGKPYRFCYFRCPRGQGECLVPLAPDRPDGWAFDGNAEAPTLTPSIQCHRCGWHGYVRDGKLVDA